MIAFSCIRFLVRRTDFVLVAVILLTHRFHMNPDNLATPLAASIGDVVSLSVFSFIASALYENLGNYSLIVSLFRRNSNNYQVFMHECIYYYFLFRLCEQITATYLWVTYALVGIYFILLPIWTTVVLYNNYTRRVLKTGWIPVLSALFISGYSLLTLHITTYH